MPHARARLPPALSDEFFTLKAFPFPIFTPLVCLCPQAAASLIVTGPPSRALALLPDGISLETKPKRRSFWPMQKLVLILLASSLMSLSAHAQASKVKERAKDLKRNVENTNAPAKTNAPARAR